MNLTPYDRLHHLPTARSPILKMKFPGPNVVFACCMRGQKALQENVSSLKDVQHKQGKQLATLQEDTTAVKNETGKIPAIEQRLDHHGKILTGLTANMATVLEEQHAQRSDIRSLHTELHESREEVKGEIREARDEARRDTIDLKATVVKKIQSLDRRTTNIEEHEGIENPDKN